MPPSENEVVLDESEVKLIFDRLAKLRSEEGEIPAPFLEPIDEEDEDPLFGESLFGESVDSEAVGEVGEVLREGGASDDESQVEKEIEPTAVPFAGCFDPNRYFDVFDLLRLEPGHRLDYVYEFLGNSGQPLLYTRKGESRIQSPYEYAVQFPGWNPALLISKD